MENAINEGACEIIGIGRPLCSDPLSIKKLLDREIDVLPKFEKLYRLDQVGFLLVVLLD